jgi:hypothetical protein
MTSQSVKNILAKAKVVTTGAQKLPVLSRTGNPYTREDENETRIRIFNLQAFRSKEDAKAASEAWLKGHKLELKGDLEGAQEHYKDAMNALMSFSVLEENAAQFENLFEVSGIVEEVPTSQETQDAGGPLTTLSLNRVKPVAIASGLGESVASLFEEPVEETAPKVTRTARKGAKAGA